MATTLIPPGEDLPLNDAEEIRERFEKKLQLVIDAGAYAMEPSTVIDLSEDEPEVVWWGQGDPAMLGLG